ncbi:MAG: 23S rRNA (adenine(2503)-C(2))-methyltransferase RlmN [candidate division WOR-3 bacterium]|nr:23S rRNA (adenine(2503)-C(2))-methyltransferase RlmN [candidate division WOR-3 bacterium]
MLNLKQLTLTELKAMVNKIGWENYRAQQIFTWLWQKGITEINQMTNLSKQKREQLKKDYYISYLKVLDRKISIDGAQKFLLELEDSNKVESVFIPEGKRRTVCVSTQVGCPLQCSICYTGKIGFIRNLKFYEIADQVLQVQLLTKQRITNVVFMGMGEPFLNYEESIKAIELINSDYGLNIGARHITVSTAGIADRIYDFAEFPLQAKLAISLNATTDEIRNKIMPINKKYPLEKLFEAIRYYSAKKKKRVTFEYVLIKGVNDHSKDILRLQRLIDKIPCKINIIPFNPFPGSEYESPSIEQTKAFVEKLYPKLPCVTIRKSKGTDILAACGQLAGKSI